jgi:hypothetical protein
MKKIIFTLLVALSTAPVFSQTIVDDTTVYIKNAGCMPKTNVIAGADGTIINNTNASISLSWTLTNLSLLSGWTLESICDPTTCKTSTLLNSNPGPYFFNIAAGASANILVDLKAGPNAADGTSYVTVTTSAGDIVYKFSTCPLGTKDFDNSNFVNIYPNPATNHINIALNDKNISFVNVTNVIGKKMAKFAVDANRSPIYIPLENVSTGVYLLQFVDSKGKIIGVKKVTKQ